ncbi:ribonuclease III, partial [Candidatus Kaiserbacteria bacterium]|nr:ribonuclease III [Candidatus Kaiserbacteria bacterium]
LIGALYLDDGYAIARDFIDKHILYKADEIVEKRLWQDPKSRLQEVAQDKMGVTPTYELVNQVGPDHDKRFMIAVFLGGTKTAMGEGRSKQEAEQDAAQKALTAKGWA